MVTVEVSIFTAGTQTKVTASEPTGERAAEQVNKALATLNKKKK